MRFSIVAATAILATAVSAADYGYVAPVASSSPAAVVTEHKYVTVDCAKEPSKCPYGGHKPTSTPNPYKPTTTSVKIIPTGTYGNGTHPVNPPTYPIVSKPGYGGGHGGKDDDDKYILTTLTTTICVPTTSVYTTKVLKPTTDVKPTGAPVPVPTGGYKAPGPVTNLNGAGSLKMGSFAVVAGVAAFILA